MLRRIHPERGFTMVEVLVGLAIGMFAILVIMQVFNVSQSYRRTTAAGADAQTNGAIALYSIERDLRMAGYGVTATVLQGCALRTFNNQRDSQQLTVRLVPVRIATGASDTMTVMYGNSRGMISGQLFSAAAAAGDDFLLKDRAGIFFDPANAATADFVVAVEPSRDRDCVLAKVTGYPAGSLRVSRGASQYNPGGGFGIGYTANAQLYNMGSTPIMRVYQVRDNVLAVCDLMRSDCADAGDPWEPVAEGVVMLRAVYALDTDPGDPNGDGIPGDGVADTYRDNVGDIDLDGQTAELNWDPDDWARVMAVRIAIVTRTREAQGAGADEITLWPGETYTVPAEFRGFRHRVFETIVPMRNMIWRPT